MGSVPTAANDPIFWLHHGNIDRLWDHWLNLGDGRQNPQDAAFLDTQYQFADVGGQVVTVRIRDVLHSAVLGYRYDNVPNPSSPEALVAKRSSQLVASSAARNGRIESTVQQPTPLGFSTATATLQVDEAQRAVLTRTLEAAAARRPGKIVMEVKDIALTATPSFTYAVYLNLPAEAVSHEQSRPHYVGTIDFFGRGEKHKAHGGHAAPGTHAAPAGRQFTHTFDITATVARLRAAGKLGDGPFTVTLRPVTTIAPPGKEEDLKRRAERSARDAKISYKRIDISIRP
jgi:hypothetical protein